MTSPTESDHNSPATAEVNPEKLRALYGAIRERFGNEAASEIWLEVFGEFDAAAQT